MDAATVIWTLIPGAITGLAIGYFIYRVSSVPSNQVKSTISSIQVKDTVEPMQVDKLGHDKKVMKNSVDMANIILPISKTGQDKDIVKNMDAIELDFVLVGKTGHGKSATGNFVMGYKRFKTSSSGSSKTSEIERAWAEYTSTDKKKYVIKVIDGPGLEDSDLSKHAEIERACRNLSKVMVLCPNGVHAFLVVVRFGNRFTREDESALHSLRQILGPDFLERFGIVVVTGGDSFQDAMDEEELPADFMSWCRQQKGELSNLFKECGYRCVLINNRNSTLDEERRQLETLLHLAENIKSQNSGARYTGSVFKKCKAFREKLLVETKAPVISEKLEKQIGLLESGLAKTTLSDDLEWVEKYVDDMLREIEYEDKGTKVLLDLEKKVLQLKKLIQLVRREKKEMETKGKTDTSDSFEKLKCQGKKLRDSLMDPAVMAKVFTFTLGVVMTIASRGKLAPAALPLLHHALK